MFFNPYRHDYVTENLKIMRMGVSGITRELLELNEERALLFSWDLSEFARIIQDVGFFCVECGKCCTAPFNGHVFLLDQDASRALQLCPDSLIPAPEFELCDEEGNFYVSGYAVRVHPDGACVHLSEGRCTIYEDRFTICRVYPYMLHREHDSRKRNEFRQISGLNEHGVYHNQIRDVDALRIAKETYGYEMAWLIQMIRFYEAVDQILTKSGQRYIRRVYDKRIQEFRKGAPVQVFVWYNGSFVSHEVRFSEYAGFGWP